ncbi:amidase [Streptomyces sp. LN549]|uniref:amidase n=1 Tax=Streptomyces sp. LN549 TaxID=3112979 RepID=UPI003711AF0C
MTDLSFASATELTALVRRRALSPEELMRHTLDRIETADRTLNSVVALDPERALAEAAAVTARIARGEDPGPLAGLPVLVKDNEDVTGFRTTHGSSAYRDKPPATSDGIHVARLRAAGALVIGKTNLPPLGAAVHTANDVFGITRNPWNPERTPGGSSGGAAAAVAAGLVALGTGGDGGGSTRIPAALCGIVGLKPSRGRIPQDKRCWTQHGCLSGMARTVRDTALHLDVAAGHHPADPDALSAPVISYVESLGRPLSPLRIGVLRTLGVAAPRPEMLSAVERTAELLRAQGHDVRDEEAVLPGAADFPAPFLLRQKILAYRRLISVLDDFTARPGDFEPWFAGLLDDAGTVTPADMAAYWRHRSRLDHWTAELFGRYDLLLLPTVPTTAWPATGPDIETMARERTVPISYTSVFNDTGHPAVTVPAGLALDGLPCAVQLVAPPRRDELALTAALFVESAYGPLHPPEFTAASARSSGAGAA